MGDSVKADDIIKGLVGGASIRLEGDTQGRSAAAEFIGKIAEIVAKEKSKFSRNFKVNISKEEYALPYNWLFGKLSHHDELSPDRLEEIMDMLLTKVRFDLLKIAMEQVRNSAITYGDYDITV